MGHPAFEVVYASGETTAGQRLDRQFPALAGHPTGSIVIQPFAPDELHGVDVLFASLPTGKSREPLARVPRDVKIVDVGGDHRFVEGWTYGLTELPGTRAAVADRPASRTRAAIRRRRSSRWPRSSPRGWWSRRGSSSTPRPA